MNKLLLIKIYYYLIIRMQDIVLMMEQNDFIKER